MANTSALGAKRPTCFVALAAAVLLVVCAVMYGIDATAAANFNSAVIVGLVAAAALACAFALVPAKVADLGNLAAVACTAYALATLLTNSINAFADTLSGITMFNSTGGIDWIVRLTVMMAVALVALIVSCFMSRDAK